MDNEDYPSLNRDYCIRCRIESSRVGVDVLPNKSMTRSFGHLGYGNGRITRPATNQSKVGSTVYPNVAPNCGNFGLARAAAGGPG
jgi:hypothetical protein